MGPSPDHNDNMILDFKDGKSPGGLGHPNCNGGINSSYTLENLSKNFPTGPVKK